MGADKQDWDGRAVELRRDLHAHPELGFEETRTAERVAQRMSDAGLEVRTGIAGTGVMGILHGDKPGRTVAWRADMDALPLVERVDLPFASKVEGVMHACGHDGHTAVGVTLAEILAAERRSLQGTVVFLFQPAEEIFQGARAMLDAGVLDEPHIEELYGIHFTTGMKCGQIGVRPGPMWSSADGFEIHIRGQGGHGAYPHLTVSPVSTAAHLAVGLPGLVSMETSAQRTAVLSVGEIRAGTAYNIIPEEAVLKGSLRTLDDETRHQIIDRMSEYAQHVAMAHRAKAKVHWSQHACPCLLNDSDLASQVRRVAIESEGEDRVEHVEPSLASDDMSLFLRERPGCYFKIGCAPAGKERPHHSPIFEMDERSLAVALRVGARVLRTASQAA